MYVQIDTIEALKRHWGTHGSLRNVVCQDLDLCSETRFLTSVNARCAVFLGCHMDRAGLDRVLETGGIVFPRLQDFLELPYAPYRTQLYTLPDLMAGLDVERPGSFFGDTVDGRIYSRFHKYRENGEPVPMLDAFAQRLHDHAIDDALADFLRSRPDVVGIMGGHALHRGDDAYRTAARLGRALARKGWLVATGGGPGAMEAGNLGAWTAPMDDDALETALETLAPSPGFHEDPERYLAYGYRVLEALSGDPRSPVCEGGGESLAVPTWFYGHEPTNQFATRIAKYFANSVREDGLVTIATRGIVFAPGRAGTVQEIFMDATQNYYGTHDVISPMVLLGSDYWSEVLPVTPLLSGLGDGRPMGELVAVADGVDEVVAFLESSPPVRSAEG